MVFEFDQLFLQILYIPLFTCISILLSLSLSLSLSLFLSLSLSYYYRLELNLELPNNPTTLKSTTAEQVYTNDYTEYTII